MKRITVVIREEGDIHQAAAAAGLNNAFNALLILCQQISRKLAVVSNG